MDAAAVLALTTKIGRIFQREDASLSYPIGFIAYEPADFAGISAPPGGFESLQTLSEFSRLVNLRPDGSVWSPSESTPLWSVVSDIYSSALVAEDPESPQMEDRVARVAAQGAAPPDISQQKYKQYEDRWNLLLQRYRAAESATSSRSGDTEQLQKHRADIKALEDEWREHGFRNQIESRQATIVAAATNFTETWSKWKLSLIEDVDYQTDTHGNRFVPTVYAPGNIVDSPTWVSIELENSEVQQLLDQSDPELARRFGHASGTETSINHIRFQATSVDIVRNWLPQGLLSARFWRFPDPEKTLDWPGIVTGLVLLRDIEIVTETQVESEPADSEAMIKGDEPSAAIRPEQTEEEQKRERVFRRFVMLFGFVFSLLFALSTGGTPHVPSVIAVPVTTALFYGLYHVFGAAIRRRRFRTSKAVTYISWFIFLAVSIALVYVLLMFNLIYGGGATGECSSPPNLTIGQEIGHGLACAFAQALIFGFALAFALMAAVVLAVVLLVVWLFTRYQPIRRTSRYFREKVQPAVFDRIADETDIEVRLDADRYPTKLFIAGFRTQPLGRVPDPDASLPW